MKQRDSKGRFIVYNNKQRYKIKQWKGKRKGEHVLIWEKHNKTEVPKGYVIHHGDENKKHNIIENLFLKKRGLHTKEHFNKYYKTHNVWNKGIKAPQISKAKIGHMVSQKQKMKARATWFNKYLNSNIKIWQLKDKGKTPSQIAKELNLTTDKVNHRWKGFNKVYNINSGRIK